MAVKICTPENSTKEYQQKAIAELNRQLANAKTEARKKKIEARLKRWTEQSQGKSKDGF